MEMYSPISENKKLKDINCISCVKKILQIFAHNIQQKPLAFCINWHTATKRRLTYYMCNL